MIMGTALIGLGLALLMLEFYRLQPGARWLDVLSMRALPIWGKVLVLGSAGLLLLSWAVYRLNRSLLAPFSPRNVPMVEVVAEHRRRDRGPKIVSIGGGTGLSTLLRGLKERTGNLTAVVTVADDGGSSGRLRKSLGLPPPGDLRSCLAALSDDEGLLSKLFQYRFAEGNDLDGHAFGNLFIAALAGVTGSFDQGLLEAGRVLAIRGRVLPSTLADVVLLAEKNSPQGDPAVRVAGESRISEIPGKIARLHLQPENPPAYPGTIRAILNADMITIGPGSLYTSILPNLLVPDLVEAIRASKAFKVFVCNVATQPGETEGYDVNQHLAALDRHVGPGLVNLVLVNECDAFPPMKNVEWVQFNRAVPPGLPFYATDLMDEDRPWRHDSSRLAETLLSLLEERTGPLQLAPHEIHTRLASSG